MSTVSSILMAAVPDQITPAATTANSGTDVVISWTSPASDQGSALTRYRITFKQTDGIFSEYSTSCDGTGVILSGNTCTVPMTAFLAAPYNLNKGDLIVAIVEGLNAVGYSTPSVENTSGALV